MNLDSTIVEGSLVIAAIWLIVLIKLHRKEIRRRHRRDNMIRSVKEE